MSKDPADTVKRITEALEVAATEVQREHRFEGIYQALMALQPRDFPDEQDGQLMVEICNSALTLSSGRNNSRLGAKCLQQLWDLYWRMSSNNQYR